MKIVLAKDKETNLDLKTSVKILNSLCKANTFSDHDQLIELGAQEPYIDFDKDSIQLKTLFTTDKQNHIFYCTTKRYENNYFFYSTDEVTILSLFGWEQCTNLPIENGLFYFIAGIQALIIDDSIRHQDTTGCVYDFLWDKTAVDLGMKTGRFCKNCLERIENKTKSSASLLSILGDVTTILNVVATSSQWDESVFEYEKLIAKSSNWAEFEDDVAQLYRKLGARVRQNVNMAGFQIDILIEEDTPSKQNVKTAVDCKFTKNKVGNRTVNDFGRIIATLSEARLVDRGIIVSQSGFTQDAFLVAQQNQVDLLKFVDLQHEVGKIKPGVISNEKNKHPQIKTVESLLAVEESTQKLKQQKSPNLFVLMPFSSDMDDVYYLGIHETAKSLGCSCERVDQIEFVGSILDKIYDSIRNSRIILAELSITNINVYYELGYAHALEKPTILITKDISSAPFDLKGYNHIVYTSIRDLRDKLKVRLEAILTS